MEDKLTIVLEQLGSDGITAFYVYLAVDYISAWLLIGILVYGARTVWKKLKDDI